jgi:hypothetical protein
MNCWQIRQIQEVSIVFTELRVKSSNENFAPRFLIAWKER